MKSFLLNNEAMIRMSFYFSILATMAFLEIKFPRRKLLVSKSKRWVYNLALVFSNSFIVRILFPGAAVAVAIIGEEQGWGLLNYYQVSDGLKILFTVIFMDFAIYIQHVMFHAVPILWRLHRVHHADLDYDVTTGARFHPIEIILSLIIKIGVIVALGAPAVGVILFEIMLNATAMFNHANFYLPLSIDRVLRFYLVTPDMHRVHHSDIDYEANSNFGFSLPWWDRMFGTYKDQPNLGHDGMRIGIHNVSSEKEAVNIVGMWMMPFKRKISGYTVNSRRRG